MSADELVDVVDENDQVVGQAARRDIRRQNLRHRSVYIFVFNSMGQLFIHQRTATKDVFPLFWDVTVGGVLGAGESYDAGAQRELAEEVGIDKATLRRLFPLRYEDDASRLIAMVYSCTWDAPLRLQAEEIAVGEWLDLDVVFERTARQPFCPDGLEALRLYLAKLEAIAQRQR